MNVDPQFLTGLGLVAFGVVLAVLAVALLVSRGEDKQATEDARPVGAAAESDAGPTAGPEDGPMPAPVVLPPEPKPADLPAAPAPPAPAETSRRWPEGAAVPDRTYPVATLRRDEVTGALSIQVEGKTYSSADELRLSDHWTRVQYAAADLTKWLAATEVPVRSAASAREETSGKPPSMIEQINAILDRRLAGSSGDRRGVRLFEGPGGSVRVFVGLNSYEIDNVPDEEVRKVIRDAVAEWEASQ